MKTTNGDQCEYCGCEEWRVSSTLIQCAGCETVWGRVNGQWVVDPETMPVDALRAAQGRCAAHAAGPLLDEWEQLPGDVRCDPELAGLARAMAALSSAMENPTV